MKLTDDNQDEMDGRLPNEAVGIKISPRLQRLLDEAAAKRAGKIGSADPSAKAPPA